jgi:subtilisin family serine protease
LTELLTVFIGKIYYEISALRRRRKYLDICEGDSAMDQAKRRSRFHYLAFTILMLLLVTGLFGGEKGNHAVAGEPAPFLVQAADMDTAVAAVTAVGGEITHELAIIHAVGANLTPRQFARLQENPDIISMQENRTLQVSGVTTETIEVRVNSSADDAEEFAYGGMYLDSTDLELVYNDSNQIVGMRFRDLQIPPGATITSATVEFETDETNSTTTSLVIQAEAVDDAAAFTSSYHNISDRPRTATAVNWNNIPAWNTVSEKQLSPDISPVIQEVVSRTGWNSGNDLVLIITGSGERTAESYDGESGNAPLLHIEYMAGESSFPSTSLPPAVVEMVADSFSARLYDRHDGTQMWAGPWVEVNDDGKPDAGHIKVDHDQLMFEDKDRGIQRIVDLASASSALLRFDYWRDNMDDDDAYVTVQVSNNGGAAWSTLTVIASAEDEREHSIELDLTPHMSAQTVLRFFTSYDMQGKLWVDDFAVEYVVDPIKLAENFEPLQDVADNFETGLYTNHDGSQLWAGPWVEFGDDFRVDGGHIRIDKEQLRLEDEDRGIQRMVDLSNASSATLSFDFWRENMDKPEEFVTLQISPDGGVTWADVTVIEALDDDKQVYTVQYDISDYMSAETVVRFRTSSGMNDKLWVDNFTIAYVAYSPTEWGTIPAAAHTQATKANLLHEQGLTGAGIGVAVIDTGFPAEAALLKKGNGNPRNLVQYDAITDQQYPIGTFVSDDESGHGSHIASIIASTDKDAQGMYAGIAPDADIVSIKAFDADGRGNYLDIIRALDWAVQHKETHNIRVINLSFSATPQSYYWDDPINQAVMRAWQAGIVVVAAAGNTGPDPMTIGVPGNLPYIITVGAASDNYTPDDMTDDYLTTFSAAGPTVEGFVKPDLVAPGGHIQALLPRKAKIGTKNPHYFDDDTDYFEMSGTSQATAMVSGIVAQMLEADPCSHSGRRQMSPDEHSAPGTEPGRHARLLHLPARGRTGERLRCRGRHDERLRQPGAGHRRRPRRHDPLPGRRQPG